ncbi:hemerythrin domain-containing protein [Micromonospora sp. NPDC049559]|uniref:hemerythrin domain-containing protein n=1 Tax=Micromonospora sp. NPDC049559 TaxID=3155923 RepID=UPI00344252BE
MTREQDVVDVLLAQHKEIKILFSRIPRETGRRKRELFEQLVHVLAVHETAEEEVVHPAARRAIQDGERVVDGRLAEEHEAKQALAELYDLGVDHPEFDGKLDAFAQAVSAHAAHEETAEFPRLRERLSVDQLQQMAGAVRAAEAAAPTRPHPHAGDTASRNLVGGPPLLLFDQLRDHVRDWREGMADQRVVNRGGRP